MRRLTNYLNKPLYGVSKNASVNSKFIGSTLLASVIATGFYLKNQKTMLLTQFNDIQNAALVDETQPESGLSPAQEKVKEAIVYTRELNEVPLDFAENYQEGKMYVHKIPLAQGNFEVLVTKIKGEFYAVANTDPYDGHTRLSKGKLFGNKLMSSNNGVAYNIKNGEVEYGPALDNIPIFKCLIKEGQLHVVVPKKPPVKIRPYLAQRDYADMRKIVIVGGGESALAAAETLRYLDYYGEIVIVTPQLDVPINKKELLKTVKYMNYDKLRIRNEQFLQDVGLDFRFDHKAKGFMAKNKQAFLLTENDTILEYDACLIATESTPIIPEMKNMEGMKNVSLLRSVEDHKNLKKYLDNGSVKKLTIFGMNPDSYEMLSTLRTEYPEIELSVVSTDKNSWTKSLYGPQVSKALKNMHENRGVKFYQGRKFIRFDAKSEISDEIGQVNLKGESIDTDYVLLFPSKFRAETDFVGENKKLSDNMKFDQFGRIKTEYNNKSGNKRIYVAGEASAMTWFLTTERINDNSFHKNFNEAFNAAYNMLGLHIPYQVVPFNQFEMYGHTIQQVGSSDWFTDCHVVGDFENMDFTAFYSKGQNIYKVLGTNKQGDIQVWNEAFRLGLMPSLNTVKNMGVEASKMVEQRIKDSGRSGCFRELIYKIRMDPIEDQILWRERTNRIADVFDKDNARITLDEMNQEIEKDSEAFFDKRQQWVYSTHGLVDRV